jgi:nickel-type superoxide dismutase
MMLDIKRLADRILPFGTADAHCDVPCGIYDPRDAIQAAQTVIRMTELIEKLGVPTTVEAHNSFNRYVAVKEEHACKLGSYVKQHVDMAKAQEFKAALEEIGAIFAESKK